MNHLKAYIPPLYTYALSLYLISILFTYPYGVELIPTKSVRFPDIFAGACIVIGLLSFIYYKPKIKSYILLPLLIFLALEMVLPVLGALIYGPLTSAASGVRIFLLYAPLLLFCLQFRDEYFSQFDRFMERILKLGVIANAVYSTIQLAVVAELIPGWLVFTRYLEPWAVDGFFNIEDGLRASGFFINTLSMSIFGIIGMSYFLGKYTTRQKIPYIVYGALSFLLVLMSTARVAYLAAFLIILLCLFCIPRKTALKLVAGIVIIVLMLCVFVEITVGLDSYFERFSRLADGLTEDYSFSERYNHLWPNALEIAQNYPFGTFIQPTQVIDLIDSGYLTFYIQGRWLYIAGLIILFIGTAWHAFRSYWTERKWYAFSTLCILIFVTLNMITHNPMRSPYIIFILVYCISLLHRDRTDLGYGKRIKTTREPNIPANRGMDV